MCPRTRAGTHVDFGAVRFRLPVPDCPLHLEDTCPSLWQEPLLPLCRMVLLAMMPAAKGGNDKKGAGESPRLPIAVQIGTSVTTNYC